MIMSHVKTYTHTQEGSRAEVSTLSKVMAGAVDIMHIENKETVQIAINTLLALLIKKYRQVSKP